MDDPIRTLFVVEDPGADPSGPDRLARASDCIEVTTEPVADAIEHLSTSEVDCVVADYDLPGYDGLAFLEAVRDSHPQVPFVLFTDDGSEQLAGAAVAAGATGYLPKSEDPDTYQTLAARIEESVDRVRGSVGPGLEGQTTIELLSDLYAVTTDTELTFEEKITRLLGLGCDRLGLAYGFLSKIDPGDGDETDGTQRIVLSHGDHTLLQPGSSCPLSEAYCRKTIQSDGLLAVSDALREGWADDPAYDVFELGSYIGGKVIVSDELYGTLCFASTDPRGAAFTDAERTLIRLMSKWASYELEHDRVTSELERQNERLEDFASVLAHDLRNPLNVVDGRLELARAECDSEHLAPIGQSVARMEVLIEDVLDLAREGRTVTETAWVDLAAVAEESWDHVATAEATLQIETDYAVMAERNRLKRLFENLFRNAVEHAGETVTVTIGSLDDGFFVADDGPGVPESDRQQVFELGYTTDEDGTGYGLAIVSEIVDAHGWSIEIGDSDDGARFEIRTR
ncbi:sensor histidine kinase [Halobellus clavatus]|uniref:histidine kinase n=1 Tax=Halobellus clavatus TaxID=660517 RepID=A0A1H3JG98_9EURY|nr:GAF domain-containing sensor histidine kinase [Halobellus clavatus]SDY38599.1 Signal transduction histidine kinase [Halobellus clavatus]